MSNLEGKEHAESVNSEQRPPNGNPVRLKPVVSSNIAAVGYGHGNLYLLFRNGGLYKGKVEPEDHMALVTAESVGKHFHRHIKPKYTLTKCPDRSEVVVPEPVSPAAGTADTIPGTESWPDCPATESTPQVEE